MAGESKINPCRYNIFEVFHLDKTETDVRAIREAIRETKSRLKFGKIIARDGTDLQLTEAQLNNLEKRLLDPVERLKEEQLAHQAHLFAKDEQLSSRLQALADKEDTEDQVAALLAETQGATLRMVNRFLPPFVPPRLADDLPWPEPPAPMEPTREGLEEMILRDQ